MTNVEYIKATIFATIVILFFGCKSEQKSDPKAEESLEIVGSPLVGKVDVWCDESLKKIISQQEEIFELAYPYAKVNMHYAPELVVKKMFYTDSIPVMILSHGIDSLEVRAFNKKEKYPLQYRFGKSAIAFIGNKNRSQLQYAADDILKMLTSGDKGQIFAIESKESGIANELLSKSGAKALGSNVYALNSKAEVFDWVSKNPSGIGIIDWSELSDEDDKGSREILDKVAVLKISGKDKVAYGPDQENMNGLYPFTRDLYFIRKMGVTDVGLGFASFICEERGQKIMLKAGLLPEYQSERWVEFKGLKDVKVVE
jgi:phosphate transport system substrate-binding protein